MSRIISKAELQEQIASQRFDGEVTPQSTDTADLIAAFNNYFKPACQSIGAMISVEDFRGGFDEMPLLYQYILSIDKTTEEGKRKLLDAHTEAIRWEAANASCVHESDKLRWKPSRWWKFCWEQDGKEEATAV